MLLHNITGDLPYRVDVSHDEVRFMDVKVEPTCVGIMASLKIRLEYDDCVVWEGNRNAKVKLNCVDLAAGNELTLSLVEDRATAFTISTRATTIEMACVYRGGNAHILAKVIVRGTERYVAMLDSKGLHTKINRLTSYVIDRRASSWRTPNAKVSQTCPR